MALFNFYFEIISDFQNNVQIVHWILILTNCEHFIHLHLLFYFLCTQMYVSISVRFESCRDCVTLFLQSKDFVLYNHCIITKEASCILVLSST